MDMGYGLSPPSTQGRLLQLEVKIDDVLSLSNKRAP